ncbi:MAG: DHHA1 domain-containing protein, partial [Flavobacteriales bacterium]
GTHVKSTGEIGLFRLNSEGAVAAGIRRIEAISGQTAIAKANEERNLVQELHQNLKQQDLLKAVADLQEKNTKLLKEVEGYQREQAKGLKGDLLAKIKEENGIPFLAERVDLGAGQIKDLAFQLKAECASLFAVFASEDNGKAMITCLVTEDLVDSKGLHAGNIVRELAKEIKGGGGGQAFFATAGGKDASGLNEALKKAINFLS